jgi:hypothetical protein
MKIPHSPDPDYPPLASVEALKSFDNTVDSSKVASALMRDGGVTVLLQAENSIIDTLADEFRPHFDPQGANQSDSPRSEFINTYSLGWLRQEENQFLTIPREIANSYPEQIRRMMGYQAHGPSLGVYPDDPDDYWFDA